MCIRDRPYTLAIILHEVLRSEIHSWDIKITANDLSEAVLAAARRGIYSEYALRTTPKSIVDTYFVKEDKMCIRDRPTGARHGAYPGHPCCCVDARRYGLAAHARNLQHVRMRTHGNDGAPMLAVWMRNSTEKYGCPSYTGNYVLGGWRVEREKSYQQKREVGIDAADK